MNQKLNIAICSYRSAPFGGGQGIFVFELSRALNDLGHQVDVISGPPYPDLENNIKLIKSPGLDLFRTFNFKDVFRKFNFQLSYSLEKVFVRFFDLNSFINDFNCGNECSNKTINGICNK